MNTRTTATLNTHNANTKIPVGISTCLMGEQVRFDGGHKYNSTCMTQLAEYFEYTPTCPELGMGMSVPRPTIRLVERDNEVRLLEVKDMSHDHTAAMNEFTKSRLPDLSHLCGYVVAKKSPSCGMERVQVYRENGHTNDYKSAGLFTKALMETYPNLPVEEDGRLHDHLLRDNFISRVFIYSQWKVLEANTLTYHELYTFHSSVKYALMAHDHHCYQTLGKFISEAGRNKEPIESIQYEYITRLMTSLKKIVKRTSHQNVLLHILGYFKDDIDATERAMLLEKINEFTQGICPLGVPISLIRLFMKKHPKGYLERQFYLFPYPKELSIREFI
ncbi:MAG: DUF1722 domain-containing protein [Pseudomonadota bacterium]